MTRVRTEPASLPNSDPLQIAQQFHRVERTLGSLFMLEVGEHVAAAGEMLRNAGDHRLPLLARITWLAEAVIHKRASRNVRRGHGFGFGDAQSRVARFQQIPGRIAEPGLMPEFKRCRHGPRQHSQKILKQNRIGLQVWWKLKQDGAEFTRSPKRFDRSL